jgi:hypothetical protein
MVIWAVAAIITAGAEATATTMVGGTTTIGDLICQSEEAASVGRPLSLPRKTRPASTGALTSPRPDAQQKAATGYR